MKYARTSVTKRVFIQITAVALIAAGVIWPTSAQKSAKRSKQPVLYAVHANHVMHVRQNQARVTMKAQSQQIRPVTAKSNSSAVVPRAAPSSEQSPAVAKD